MVTNGRLGRLFESRRLFELMIMVFNQKSCSQLLPLVHQSRVGGENELRAGGKAHPRQHVNYDDNTTFPRLACPTSIGARYSNLRMGPVRTGESRDSHSRKEETELKHFSALHLHQSVEVAPRRTSSVVRTMRYLDPEYSPYL